MSELFNTENTVPIIHRTLIRAPREKVFKAMTTSEGIDKWFTEGTTIERKNGGILHFKWRNWGPDKISAEAICPILIFDEPSKFVFQWWPDHYTTVAMEFTSVNDGTILTVKEWGYANTEEGHKRCLECATGWGEAMTLLKFYVEHGLRY